MAKSPPAARSHVRVLGKAIAILECINRRNGLTAGAIAVATGLPRGTVFRLAETLTREGLLTRDPTAGAYWLTHRVLGLSQGYVNERWVPAVLPIIKRLEAQLMWPINISTPDGNWMEVRCATDPDNMFVYRGVSVGYRFPMIVEGRPIPLIGRWPLHERKAILRSLYLEFQPEPDCSAWEARMLTMLDEINQAPWQASSTSKSHTLTVPLIVGCAPFGLLTMWTFPRSMTLARMHLEAVGPMLQGKEEVEAILNGMLARAS